jgi:putative PIN family toxin of toxin-antitoxin system
VPYVAVFDTNVLFSGLGWRGSPFQCLQLARQGRVQAVTCREILTEFEAKLRLKRNMSPAQAVKAVLEVLLFSRLVMITNTLRAVAADPHDDKVVECAVVGGATHIVTGDRRQAPPIFSHSCLNRDGVSFQRQPLSLTGGVIGVHQRSIAAELDHLAALPMRSRWEP